MILLTPAKHPLYYRYSLAVVLLMAAFMVTLMLPVGAQAAPNEALLATSPNANVDTDSETEEANNDVTTSALAPTLAIQRQPTPTALSTANQNLVSENIKLQRQVNDLQTQVNVLIYESKGQLFVYGAMTALISLALGAFISWLVVRRRSHW